ncbi:MAG: radical SAM protein [Thaumarchaeota archaeon]|nr:radical SAM protein [Nitrososphaerota archaeon]
MAPLKIREVRCKTLLHEMYPGEREYTANFYRGCSHGCTYCYVPSLIHDERSWGAFVDAKVNSPEVLNRELKGLRMGRVFLSSATDPYQPLEARYGITRRCLEVLLRHDFPVVILTRSPLVLKDIDLLKRFEWVRVGFSISSVPERLYEPGVSPLERRIESLRKLSDAGIETWVSMAPLIPSLMRIDLRVVMKALRAAGVSAISPGILRFQGYPESKEMFEKVAGVSSTDLTLGGDKVIADVEGLIEEYGFEGVGDVLDWRPKGGLDDFLGVPNTRQPSP